MSTTFLRRVLALDAITCTVTGIAMAAGASLAAPLLNLPAGLIEASGLALLPFAALLGWLASREAPPVAGVWFAIAVNAVWVIDSIALAAGAWAQPNTLGITVIIVQALAVATLAELEYVGLRKLRTAVTA